MAVVSTAGNLGRVGLKVVIPQRTGHTSRGRVLWRAFHRDHLVGYLAPGLCGLGGLEAPLNETAMLGRGCLWLKIGGVSTLVPSNPPATNRATQRGLLGFKYEEALLKGMDKIEKKG